MKRNDHKNHKQEALNAVKHQEKMKPMDLLPHGSESKASQRSGLETLHRLSWRRYILSIASPFIITMLSSGPIFAATDPAASASTQESALVSKETAKQIIKKTVVDSKKKVTKASENKPATGAVKKKGFTLPERDPELEKLATVVKSTEGTVTGVNHQGVAVEYAIDKKLGGMEIWFNYVKGMKLVGIKDQSELSEGDTVKVDYREAPDHRRLINEIALVQKKPAEPAVATASEGLQSKETP